MKKTICCLLCVVIILTAGFAAAAENEKSSAKAALSYISSSVAATAEMLPAVQDIIDWQITESEADMEAQKQAEENGETYVAEDNDEEIRARQTELEGYMTVAAGYAEGCAALEKTGIEQVDMTIDAACEYFDEVDSAFSDLMSIFDFYFAIAAATESVTAFDGAQYEDQFTAMSDLYNMINDACSALKAIDCPSYMSQTFAEFTKSYNDFNIILDSSYTAGQLGDSLRAYSASNLLGEMTSELDKYATRLTEDFNFQYAKVAERLSGGVGTLQGELLENCDLLSAYV